MAWKLKLSHLWLIQSPHRDKLIMRDSTWSTIYLYLKSWWYKQLYILIHLRSTYHLVKNIYSFHTFLFKSSKKTWWRKRTSNQFLLNGKIRLFKRPLYLKHPHTCWCSIRKGHFSSGWSDPAEQKALSSRDLPLWRMCRKLGRCSRTRSLLESRRILYYKSERRSNKTNLQRVRVGTREGKDVDGIMEHHKLKADPQNQKP